MVGEKFEPECFIPGFSIARDNAAMIAITAHFAINAQKKVLRDGMYRPRQALMTWNETPGSSTPSDAKVTPPLQNQKHQVAFMARSASRGLLNVGAARDIEWSSRLFLSRMKESMMKALAHSLKSSTSVTGFWWRNHYHQRQRWRVNDRQRVAMRYCRGQVRCATHCNWQTLAKQIFEERVRSLFVRRLNPEVVEPDE